MALVVHESRGGERVCGCESRGVIYLPLSVE